ncbi:AMP-binding protein [Luteococcus peritonei]|uniref:AMP-binding protein n=1 Tax=Luteococcus peritonei TaxID=88874 RepID=A0ABW4RVC4_9ACTN
MPPAEGCSQAVDGLALRQLETMLEGGAALALGPVLRPLAGREVDDEMAVVCATSGTTGRPKAALLDTQALTRSARAVLQVLGGPGQSLLAVAPWHISGLSVCLRNLLHELPTIRLGPGPFTGAGFAQGVRRLDPTAPRHYSMVVPTQLRRLLACPEGRAAAADLDALIVGGAALSPALRGEAEQAGIRVVEGYGCSETTGGCVYDGLPLPGVAISLATQGRISLHGAPVALGYLDRPELDHAFGHDARGRSFRTEDHGHLDDQGRLVVLGRLDEVINSGGLKVAPRIVEEAMAQLPWPAEVLVLGSPDPEWGEAVTVLACGGGPRPTVAELREALRAELPAHALPRRLEWVEKLPTTPNGKPDRRAARSLLSGR